MTTTTLAVILIGAFILLLIYWLVRSRGNTTGHIDTTLTAVGAATEAVEDIVDAVAHKVAPEPAKVEEKPAPAPEPVKAAEPAPVKAEAPAAPKAKAAPKPKAAPKAAEPAAKKASAKSEAAPAPKAKAAPKAAAKAAPEPAPAVEVVETAGAELVVPAACRQTHRSFVARGPHFVHTQHLSDCSSREE